MATRDAAWWTDYRARKKAEKLAAEKPVEVPKLSRGKSITSEEIAKVPKTSGMQLTYEDYWVQRLTQKQRDAILEHPAIKTAKRSRND